MEAERREWNVESCTRLSAVHCRGGACRSWRCTADSYWVTIKWQRPPICHCEGALRPWQSREGTSSSYKVPIKTHRPIASVAASPLRGASALYRGIKPQEGTGAPRVPLTCHCEEQSDVAISQYPAASWESYRRKRSYLPEIAPQGHFLALRAQGATSACGLLAMTNLRASRHRMRTAKVASLHGAH